MIYIMIRHEISRYLIAPLSCDYMFHKIESMDDDEVRIDFLMVYYISPQFLDEYIKDRLKSKKHIIELNVPYAYKSKLSFN
ncbi:hypothetical protein [Acidiplasma sp.]|uniref:hypothetical protein n=1 Tax=Acidiplasma sp. TaxID=1872114 RepID=UPI00258ADF3E|nr:hypothetical protein [Acidiplasma sp.]